MKSAPVHSWWGSASPAPRYAYRCSRCHDSYRSRRRAARIDVTVISMNSAVPAVASIIPGNVVTIDHSSGRNEILPVMP